MENIQPTQDALLQHIKHVVYQAGIWTTSEQGRPLQNLWAGNGTRAFRHGLFIWTTLPIASKACMESLKCGWEQGWLWCQM